LNGKTTENFFEVEIRGATSLQLHTLTLPVQRRKRLTEFLTPKKAQNHRQIQQQAHHQQGLLSRPSSSAKKGTGVAV
jgi:hypothetical protein